MTTRNFRLALIGQDYQDGIAYWRDRQFKKWAVHVWTGRDEKPTMERVLYIRSATADGAKHAAKHNTPHTFPASAKFAARLAGPRELGATPEPRAGGQP